MSDKKIKQLKVDIYCHIIKKTQDFAGLEILLDTLDKPFWREELENMEVWPVLLPPTEGFSSPYDIQWSRWAKTEFAEEAEEIRQGLRRVGQNVGGADFFVRDYNKNKLRQRWARERLNSFLNRVTSRLDEKGYLEIRYAPVEEGYSHTL